MSEKAPRRLVLHADDVGMAHGCNVAFAELSQLGTCSAGSVMVPCPWFLEAAELAAKNTYLDLGVHLTLNCEYEQYKWRPVSAPPASAGLTDDRGYFHRSVATTRRQAHPDAVATELRMQITLALSAGIDVTHLDAHMGAALAPEFCQTYVELGREFGLPVLMPSRIARYGPKKHLAGSNEDIFLAEVERARKSGMPVFNDVPETAWTLGDEATQQDRTQIYRHLITEVGEGLTYFSLHFCAPGEIEFITPKSWRARVGEYELFRQTNIRDWLAEQDIELVGMRPMRDALRRGERCG
jgi:predicted glycoside hydrolase/deacetylase ChbG (UPF0249 family)